jgi:predicted transcriptional regulator
MKEPRTGEAGDTRVDSIDRRDFCKKAIRRTSIAAAVGIAGYIAYKKPVVRSFFGAKEAYANATAD